MNPERTQSSLVRMVQGATLTGFFGSLLLLRVLTSLFSHEPLSSRLDRLIEKKGQNHKAFSLEGVDWKAEFPRLSKTAWFSGGFQKGYEAWIEKRLAFRGLLVRIENQLSFSLFRQVPVRGQDPLVLGQDNWLYMKSYVVDRVANPQTGEAQIEQICRSIQELQGRLRDRGIAFLVVIAPNKAQIHPEHLPKRYQTLPCNPRPTRREKFIACFDRMGIGYVDGHALAQRIKSKEGVQIFSKGGIHWNHYAAFKTLVAIVEALAESSSTDWPKVRCSGYRLDHPGEANTDLARVVNGLSLKPWQEPCPFPKSTVESESGAGQANLLVVGDSFSCLLVDYLRGKRLCQKVDYLFYYYLLNWMPFDPEDQDWEELLLRKDAVILEINEALLPNIHLRFIQDANRVLAAGRS